MNKPPTVPTWFQSGRILLRASPTRAELDENARRDGWSLEEEIDSDPRGGIYRELRWSSGPLLKVHLIEDPTSATSYFVVTGRDPQFVQSLASDIAKDFDTWSIDELLEIFDETQEPHALARAAVRLGLAAPHVFDARVFKRIERALKHPEDGVRHAAMWATSYSPWPRYRIPLRDAANNDPNPELREAAQAVLDGFDAEGIGEP